MRALFYKDWKHSKWFLIIMSCLTVTISTFMIIHKTMIWSLIMWIGLLFLILPVSVAFSDREHKGLLFEILPIKRSNIVLLRYIYTACIFFIISLYVQILSVSVNIGNGCSSFNINNMVSESIIMIALSVSSLCLMLTFLIKSNFVILLIGFNMGFCGVLLGFFSQKENNITHDFTQPLANPAFDFLFKPEFHIILWCVCLLISFAGFAIANITSRQRRTKPA